MARNPLVEATLEVHNPLELSYGRISNRIDPVLQAVLQVVFLDGHRPPEQTPVSNRWHFLWHFLDKLDLPS
jgi:hypothetical protein